MGAQGCWDVGLGDTGTWDSGMWDMRSSGLGDAWGLEDMGCMDSRT